MNAILVFASSFSFSSPWYRSSFSAWSSSNHHHHSERAPSSPTSPWPVWSGEEEREALANSAETAETDMETLLCSQTFMTWRLCFGTKNVKVNITAIWRHCPVVKNIEVSNSILPQYGAKDVEFIVRVTWRHFLGNQKSQNQYHHNMEILLWDPIDSMSILPKYGNIAF